MMGARVTITFQGIDEVTQNLSDIEVKSEENLVKLMAEFAGDTETAWRQNTPRRSGRTQGEERVEPSGLSFTLQNTTYYYDWLNDGHWTPRGWRTRHGYRPAKRRSHVAGREMTQKTLEFVKGNILDYLSKFLDGV